MRGPIPTDLAWPKGSGAHEDPSFLARGGSALGNPDDQFHLGSVEARCLMGVPTGSLLFVSAVAKADQSVEWLLGTLDLHRGRVGG